MRRRTTLIAIYVTFVLAFLGLVVFVGGVVVEFFAAPRPAVGGALSPAILVALMGLCAAALMFLSLFTLIGWSLARQTRARGSGYGDAYRLIEAFRFGDAIPLLERSIREGKETSEVLMLLTSAYAYTGQLAKAQATADRAVELFPNDPESYVTLANGYRLQAAYAEAALALEQAAALAADQPIIWAELGFVQRFAGQAEQALESFEHAAAHAMPAPYGVRVFYHLAKAYETVGEARKAVRATAKMMSARAGLGPWKTALKPLEGTAYGQALRYEIAAIEQAIADADAGNLG
ncbi:MAG: tetratricopeptide repeat protein [Chloroflexi bacterium]|nr:tetratricopeptide repeat protein [Chloroflexota bacterium]